MHHQEASHFSHTPTPTVSNTRKTLSKNQGMPQLFRCTRTRTDTQIEVDSFNSHTQGEAVSVTALD